MTLEDKNLYANEDPEEEEEEEDEDEDEEELEDPQDTIRASCSESSECAPLKEEFDNCEERVNSRSQTTEDCTQELFDFLHCADTCVSKELFNHLK